MERRNWLITGIGSGFGRLLTEQLLARGDGVAGTLRNVAGAQDLKAIYGHQLWTATLDLCQTGAIRHVVERAWQAFGHIDVLVSNAGYGLMRAAEELTDEQVWEQLDTNLLGSIQLIRAALPHLRAQGGGRILQLSRIGGQASFPGGSLYHATQWGIEGFVDAVAQEVGVFGIECTLVEPGGARTDKTRLSPGDPRKMVQAMIASVDQTPAPRRLVLGSDAYSLMKAQLVERLEALEKQRELACGTDAAMA